MFPDKISKIGNSNPNFLLKKCKIISFSSLSKNDLHTTTIILMSAKKKKETLQQMLRLHAQPHSQPQPQVMLETGSRSHPHVFRLWWQTALHIPIKIEVLLQRIDVF